MQRSTEVKVCRRGKKAKKCETNGGTILQRFHFWVRKLIREANYSGQDKKMGDTSGQADIQNQKKDEKGQSYVEKLLCICVLDL